MKNVVTYLTLDIRFNEIELKYWKVGEEVRGMYSKLREQFL